MSRWTRPVMQLWPLGKIISGWNGVCPWPWSTERRRLDRCFQLRLGRFVTANRLSTSGRKRKVTFTSTARKCWQYIWAFEPFCQTWGASHLSSLGQYDGGLLYKSPGRSFLEAPVYSSRVPLEVGSAQLALAESNACAGQTEPGSRHAISEQCPQRWVDAPPTNGSGNMGNLRQAIGQPLNHLEDNTHCQTYFSKDKDAERLVLLYAFPLIALIPQVIRRIRKQKHRVLLVAPLWSNQHWFTELPRLLTAAPWPIPLRRDLLNDLETELWALHLCPLGGSLRTFQRVC